MHNSRPRATLVRHVLADGSPPKDVTASHLTSAFPKVLDPASRRSAPPQPPAPRPVGAVPKIGNGSTGQYDESEGEIEKGLLRRLEARPLSRLAKGLL